MIDLEMVILGINHEMEHAQGKCGHYCNDKYAESCPYDKDRVCILHWGKDALSLLRERRPRLLTITEILETYPMCWFENRATHSGCYCQIMPAVIMNDGSNVIDVQVFGIGIQTVAFPAQYNQLWRCWTSRPTEEQMKAEKWND